MPKALISVTDKTGLPEIALHLIKHNFEIIASSGTYQFLKQNNIQATLISDYTGVPETSDGRVKTLHPQIYTNILNSHDNTEDTIDVVIVNLYDFKTKQSVESIDIGGVCLLRATAKNFERKIILSHPSQYQSYINGVAEPRSLAYQAFQLTAKYDHMIMEWLKP